MNSAGPTNKSRTHHLHLLYMRGKCVDMRRIDAKIARILQQLHKKDVLNTHKTHVSCFKSKSMTRGGLHSGLNTYVANDLINEI